jgi:hypothetical protein
VTVKFWTNSRKGKQSFYSPKVQTGSGAHSASCSVDKRALSPVVRRPRHEDDYSPPFSVEIKNA